MLTTLKLSLLFATALVIAGCHSENDDDEDQAESTSELSADRKVLNVQYRAQENGYFCGPASTRIALSARMSSGNLPSQDALAGQLPTDSEGTDRITQVTATLNARLGGGKYQTREFPDGTPMSAGQKSTMWNDITRSIDAGYAVVTNIQAPANNHPPGYPNRLVRHYFTVTGYSADHYVFISDPANFSGHSQYWITFDLLASIIPPKGYSTAIVGVTCPNGRGTVIGAIKDKYQQLGACGGKLGAPTTEELTTPDEKGRYTVFEHGSIYWKAETGAHEVLGRIRDAWKEKGWEAGALGYPTSGEYTIPGGRQSDFEHGVITWDSATNTTTVTVH